MKNNNTLLLLFLLCLLCVFSAWQFLSIVAGFLILPLMLLLALRENTLFTLVPPLLWNGVLLYPVLLVGYHSYSLMLAVFSFLVIIILLSLPLYALLLCYKASYKTKKYRLLSPLVYLLLLYLLKGTLFQTLPVIMIFQSEWLRYIAGWSVSVWLTSLVLLYIQLYVAEVINNKSIWQPKACLLFISILLLANLLFTNIPLINPTLTHPTLTAKKISPPASGIKLLGIPLAVALGDSADLQDIIVKLEQALRNDPDSKLVVFSESSWLGFKPDNNYPFTQKLIAYLKEKSITDKRIYLLQIDGLIDQGREINQVLTLKIENGQLWYSGKTILVPGWETSPIPSAMPTLSDTYFTAQKTKKTFMVEGVTIRPQICYEVLFMPPLLPYTDHQQAITLVQSSYIVFYSMAGKRAYDHIVRVSNLLGWFSHSARHQIYINIQNQGGSEAISATGKQDRQFFNDSWHQPAITTIIQQ